MTAYTQSGRVGAPNTGFFQVGDRITDANGKVFVCSVAGWATDVTNRVANSAQFTLEGQEAGSAGDGNYFRSAGNLSVQVSSAGLGNAADTTDDVLMTYALPANVFDVAGRQITIVAAGKTAATANNKQIKIWFGTTTQTVGLAVAGGTLILGSGVVTTNNGGWLATVQVTKYGAAGSNTQLANCGQIAAGATHLGAAAPVALTATESGAINITVTGASSTTGAANDVLCQLLDISIAN